MKILICGLPGSGKSTFARELAYHFLLPHHNADTIRELYDDWDFSEAGRVRQALRMKQSYGILDFVCPTDTTRELVEADYVIWMDTIEKGRFEDTNKIFVPLTEYDMRITKWIGLDLLRNSLEDFSPGIKGIQSYLKEQFPKLVK